jgi:hypothetical protein
VRRTRLGWITGFTGSIRHLNTCALTLDRAAVAGALDVGFDVGGMHLSSPHEDLGSVAVDDDRSID